MDVLATLVALQLLMPLWAVLASPLLLASWWLLRMLRRHRVRSPWAMLAFATAFSLLGAPMPTPIITILYPHALMLMGPESPLAERFPEMQIWRLWSLAITFVVAFVLAWLVLRTETQSDAHEPA
ncbi:hypothetical protein [Lysobacter sp.]|uniref:hypothetical protein n=1 Tax=Lysobacter sp. TaxID=72226 RepID=UPI002D43FA6B|nr:hypothetical protein [Lysobacter sp.]HZX78009.1 hypothetical protein [Lysobacter sp.]